MGNGNDPQGWGMGDGMGWGGWLMMTVFFIVCLTLLGGLLYVLVRGPRAGATPGIAHGPARPAPSIAEATLDERFARGEIDEPEYRSRKGALRAR